MTHRNCARMQATITLERCAQFRAMESYQAYCNGCGGLVGAVPENDMTTIKQPPKAGKKPRKARTIQPREENPMPFLTTTNTARRTVSTPPPATPAKSRKRPKRIELAFVVRPEELDMVRTLAKQEERSTAQQARYFFQIGLRFWTEQQRSMLRVEGATDE
ncbi:MAG: hypothetical protein HQL56_05715 [Magnetococcales bacterium]|nr:hypothetical protein [Magnetococcales bacterium]